MPRLTLEQAGRVPAPGDNVAIAGKRLDAGSAIALDGTTLTLPHTVMEGHRFALRPIAPGEPLLSWGLPFGKAIRPIAPGDYVCNAKILASLSQRNIDFPLPQEPNFQDHLERYVFDEKAFRPGRQVPRYGAGRTFMGFRRGPGRGVGTRNAVVILGTTSLTAGYARTLAERFRGARGEFPNVDGVVAVTHTEGGGSATPNNLEFILRTLAGFITHPNVGAVLAVDFGTEAVTNAMVRGYLREKGYPLDGVTHEFISLSGDFHAELERGEKLVRGWLPEVNRAARTAEPVASLRVALQCGGSDAFSGVSGNPLAGWVAKETIRWGGAANLAETDELIGAEPYVLSNVRDLATARKFLEKIDVFRERVGHHGHSAEGNPSGGNNFRGLYNIAIKSIGAARKKAPDVRLDYVIDYGEPMAEPGYYFMDSPGNDLESIAGQVASGCNVILFTTGNGSITNFPFVPTLKIVTTTPRFNLLAHEMDVNAGRYQDGCPMDELGAETFELMLDICAGRRCLGEKAGHSQVAIWRNWAQADGSQVQRILNAAKPSGRPLPVKKPAGTLPAARFEGIRTARGVASDRIGLILPTSICSGEVARQIAAKLNAKRAQDGAFAGAGGVSRYVALVHTEGCGSAGSDSLFLRTLLGHVVHPSVHKGLLLEHGCEKTHNDAVRHFLKEQGVDDRQFGWASIQMDGGIERVTDKVERWFAQPSRDAGGPAGAGLEHVRLALTATGEIADGPARGFARLAQAIAMAGGLAVVPRNAGLLRSKAFREALLAAPEDAEASLAYGQPAPEPGLHIMDSPTDHSGETLTGLGATGVEAMLAHVYGPPLQSHPMIPLVQVSGEARTVKRFGKDLDLVLEANAAPEAVAERLLEMLCQVLSRRYTPRMFAQGNTDFQMTRGLLGVSM